KIATAGAKISAGVAQDVNQLQTHSVTLGQVEHLRFTSGCEFRQVTKTESRPKFTGAAGNEISVFVELGRCFQGGDLLRIVKTLQIQQLPAINLSEDGTHIVAVLYFHLLQPIQD